MMHRIEAKPGRAGTHVYMVEEMSCGRWVEVAGPFTTWQAAEQYMNARAAGPGSRPPAPLTHDDVRAIVHEEINRGYLEAAPGAFAALRSLVDERYRSSRGDVHVDAIEQLAEARLRAAQVVAEQMAADRACACAQAADRHKVR
ncbi:hypothetical protein [Rhodococcus daqingensis]|uniref:Uncharacterized protein n=1 Tax=Rhodococcus daqingensis TaxID=2479363 RepID=A0ABW2S2Y1_9NOCA